VKIRSSAAKNGFSPLHTIKSSQLSREAMLGGIAVGRAVALAQPTDASSTRASPRNPLDARRQPVTGLQDTPNAIPDPEPPFPAQASNRRAQSHCDGTGALLHTYLEPVQSSRSTGGGVREQEAAESEIRASVRDEAHLLPFRGVYCGQAPCSPHDKKRCGGRYSRCPLVPLLNARVLVSIGLALSRVGRHGSPNGKHQQRLSRR